MTIATQNFAALIANWAAVVQAQSTPLVDFTEGSILLAVDEADGSVALFLQSLVLQLLAVTRAATSNGPDLDSFVGDFGLTRDPAVGAHTLQTFTSLSPSASATIPVGFQVQTGDGTQTFAVTLDTSNAYWNVAANAYLRPANTASIIIPVQAITGGAASNVLANTITVVLAPISGFDTTTNASAATGGVNAETDPALRIRFQQFIASLASGTVTAIETAAEGVQAGLTIKVNENVDPNGNPDNGYLYVVIDDGTGNPSSTLINEVTAAIDTLARAAGIRFGVFGPTLTSVSVSMTATVLTGYTHSAVAALIVSAVTAYIQTLPLGTPLLWTRLYQVAYDASPGINELTALLINGGTADIAASGSTVIRPTGGVTVS